MGFFSKIFLLLLLLSIVVDGGVHDNTVEDDTCDLPQELVDEIKSYEETANKIINSITNGKFKGQTYNELGKFVDRFGARVAGTQNLEDAIDYALNLMTQAGLDNVHGEEVQIPHWVRNEEHAELLYPRRAKIPVLGLGTSVSTPAEGIEAEAIVVRTFDELSQQNFSSLAKGRIIIFNEDWSGYGNSVAYRTRGASEAAKLGAVATLVRSVTPFSMSSLHTGAQDYEEGIAQIPAASITKEDAKMFQRYQDRGEKIVLKLHLNYTTYPETTSRNSVGEIKGSSLPDKVVLVSGHIDSWDVGVGAMDDGGGAFISWYSLAVLKALGLSAKRTLRAVLWTAEEPGLVGWQGYNDTHYKELDNFTFVMESDEGTFTPQGVEYAAGNKGGCMLQEIAKLLTSINATHTVSSAGGVGSDISPWTASQIPGASLLNANERYFWYHHSQGDTMDVLDPDDLDKATALWAVVSYIVADLTNDFPRERDNLVKNIDDSLLVKVIKNSIKTN